ncbi:histidine phosphatase family protein [Novosphingobium rosa]|uniref:histidine phosphatase family protein n=1 Tax=Novosphingobium rosa TaxID=76978 RepID=UPI000835EF0A|nr:histidine phosphatase family protein [Novosphingobium rosa]
MFVIVRHGNTFAASEAPRRIGARTDLPLTGSGQQQARALGAHFAAKGWHFGQALISPLRRTRETAEAILAAQPSPPAPQPRDWLAEIDHGPDENRTEDEVLARLGPDALAAWDHHATPPPGWTVEAETRKAAWRDLFAAPPGNAPLLLVTSNGAARFALLADPALAQAAQALPHLKLPTGSYGVIQRGEDGDLHITDWGVRP